MITPAYAQAAGGGSPGDFLIQMFPFILIFVVIYFLMIRPQQQKAKQHRAMIDAVRRGDVVVTSGGLVGKVTRVNEDSDEIQVEISEGVRVKVIRGTLADVRSKSEPVPANDSGKAEK